MKEISPAELAALDRVAWDIAQEALAKGVGRKAGVIVTDIDDVVIERVNLFLSVRLTLIEGIVEQNNTNLSDL